MTDIKKENRQLSKFMSVGIDVVAIYRSQEGNLSEVKENLANLITGQNSVLIIGDFNYCFWSSPNNSTKQYLRESDFSQLVKEPTHIEGNTLDHAYIKDKKRCNEYFIHLQTKYFTDHKGITVIVRKT